MSVPKFWRAMVGTWKGTNKLWLTPSTPVAESDTTATVELLAKGHFLGLRYTWSDDGQVQEGFTLIGARKDGTHAQATWIDSWHMGDSPMACVEVPAKEGVLALLGSYPAPTGPDWGWRLEFEPEGENRFTMRMVNITPKGEEALAVLAQYTRVK